MKKVLALLALVALAAGGYYFYAEEEQKRLESAAQIVIYGNVDIRDVSLSFRVSGRIAELRYEEGDRVDKGDVVAVLDKETYLDDLALYTAQMEEARVTRNKVEKPFLRRAELTKIGAISTEERDDAEAARDEAQARVQSAEALLQKARTNLKDTELVAPNDGVILTRVREPGAVVSVGEPVYTLALDNPVWVRTYIDEPNLGKVYPGQKATVTTDSGREYRGQVGFISPQAEFTPKSVETTQLRTDLVYRLRVIVDMPDKGLRQGMPVTVKLLKEEGGAKPALPEKDRARKPQQEAPSEKAQPGQEAGALPEAPPAPAPEQSDSGQRE
ncbi:efflux RND transporter periplasmic adaptor subunit [Desulfovibrio sp. OttesenSCG-928-A18]|nr:efflux RND transporter periplasmic adaptor subunit [Desulfovibrio sp. OttesenSCG-928-A18]